MKYLFWITMLSSSMVQAQEKLTVEVDKKGKMVINTTDPKKVFKNVYELRLPNTPGFSEVIPYFEDYCNILKLQKLKSLNPRASTDLFDLSSCSTAQTAVQGTYNLSTADGKTSYEIKNKNSGDLIEKTSYGASVLKLIDITVHPEVVIVKPNHLNNALFHHYSSSLANVDLKALKSSWIKLIDIDRKLWALKDKIYTYFQLYNTEQGLVLYTDIINEYNNLDAEIKSFGSSQAANFDNWMLHWAAIKYPIWTINPLGITDLTTVPYLNDTATVKAAIDNINSMVPKKLSKTDMHYLRLRKDNLTAHLEKLRGYKVQFDQSSVLKKQFAQNTVIAKISLKPDVDYHRIHDAADDFKLTNKADVEKQFYYDFNKISILSYNIPMASKLNIDATSVGFYEVPQGSRFLGELFTGITNSTGNISFISPESYNTIIAQLTTKQYIALSSPDSKARRQAENIQDKILKLESLHATINVYTAFLPPVVNLKYSDDQEDGYTTNEFVVGPHQKDSSIKTTYTLSVRPEKDSEAKEEKKFTFSYKAYKKHRIQFAAGLHWFVGDAPLVVKDGNSFKITSDNSFRYSAGIKIYPIRQTFSDIRFSKKSSELPAEQQYFHRLIRSVHFIALLDLQKPLHNLYVGAGVDLLPGLGLEVGPHFYRYTAYQMYNDVIVAEKNIYALRNGVHLCATVDGSVLQKLLTSIIKK